MRTFNGVLKIENQSLQYFHIKEVSCGFPQKRFSTFLYPFFLEQNVMSNGVEILLNVNLECCRAHFAATREQTCIRNIPIHYLKCVYLS